MAHVNLQHSDDSGDPILAVVPDVHCQLDVFHALYQQLSKSLPYVVCFYPGLLHKTLQEQFLCFYTIELPDLASCNFPMKVMLFG